MARPKRSRAVTPSAEQVRAGLDWTRERVDAGISGSSTGDGVGLLGGWLEQGTGVERPGRDEHITHSTDSHGHHGDVRTKVPTAYTQLIGQIIQRGDVPAYRTVGDFVRDAIAHRLWDIAEGCGLSADEMSDLHVERAREMLESWVARNDNNDRLVEEARNTLRMCAGKPGVEKVLRGLKVQALGMDHPWRGELLGIVAEYEVEDG